MIQRFEQVIMKESIIESGFKMIWTDDNFLIDSTSWTWTLERKQRKKFPIRVL